MKKVIIGLLLICVVAGLVAVGTWAAFRDVETSTDNLFVAGSMDLKVDGQDDPIKAYFDTIECVKPGDSGEVDITLSNVGCVDGLADIHIFITESDENIAVEPELNVGDTADDLGNMFDGELAAYLEMKITADLDLDGVYETLVAEGSVGDIACTNYVYGALNADSSIELLIEWWVPAEVGNIIMTDTLEFSIEFSLDQAMAACLTVISIDQPDLIQECETIDISVDVRNQGGASGECDLNVTVTYPDDSVLASAVVPTGMIASLQTVPVLVFDDLHIEDTVLAVPYILTVTATSCCGEPMTCEIEVTSPPCLTVVDIVQPTNAYWCEDLTVQVGVHNEGGKPGECTVTVIVADASTQAPIMAPVTVPVPVVAPCDTVWVAVNLGHVEEYWPGLIVVVAGACCDIEPYICLPPIVVGPPPPVGNVGSTWTYDVTYATAPPTGPEVTTQTYTMMARGLTDPLPAANCVTVPSGEGPYYYMQLNTNPTCVCPACTTLDTPYRTMQNGAMGMVFLGMDIYGKESNSTSQMTFAPACAVFPMTMASVAEIAYSEYTLVSGSIGYPYAVGDSWTSRMSADAWLGVCGSAMGLVLVDTITTSVVVAVGVANPSGGYLDCVHITESAAPQVDQDGDGFYSEDPINGSDDDGDTLVDEDPVETAAPCVSDIYWSPTVKNMVERILPCSYDLPETWLLTSYTLAP